MSNLKKISEFPTETLAGTQKFLVEQSDGTYANVLGSDLSGGGSTPDLQTVTNVGNTTTNSISVVNTGVTSSAVNQDYVIAQDLVANRYSVLNYDGSVVFGNGVADSYLKNTNVTYPNQVTLEFPNKATGSYTIATTADLTTGGIPHATASGTDTYTATITGVTSYADGDAYLIRFTNANTDTSTLNINSLGAVTLYRNNDGQLIGGDIWAGGEMLCIYNSTLGGFQCIGTSPNSLFAYVTNADSVTINKGEPVYAFGSTGNRMSVKLAYNTTDATSAQTYGLVYSTSIAANQKGIIIIQGTLTGLNLGGTWVDGDPVYLGATAGSKTKTKPYAPNHLVYLGVVERANAGNGIMYVRIQNGYEMDELHNVSAQSPSLNDGLFYNTSTSLWETKSIATVLGYTPQAQLNGTGFIKASGTTISYDNSTYQTQLNGTGFVKVSGTTVSYDNSTYLTSAAIGVTVQGYSASTTLLGNTTTGSGSTLVLSTSPTFTTGITNPQMIGGTLVTSKITFKASSNASATTAASNLYSFFSNNTTELLRIGDSLNSGVDCAIWGAGNSGSGNYAMRFGSTYCYINGSSDARIMINGSGIITCSSTTATMNQGITFSDGKNITFNSTTGTKIGSATTEKLAFWNATPNVQPTTAITAAAFVANTSLIANDTATFGGYTIGQVVAALKRIGLLA